MEVASAVIELPSTVDPNLNPHNFLPDPTSEPVSAEPGLPPSSTDAYFPDEQDFSATLDVLDPTFPVERHPSQIENDKLPSPERDDARPFPEDFAIRGLLWTEAYFPEQWFTNEKIENTFNDGRTGGEDSLAWLQHCQVWAFLTL